MPRTSLVGQVLGGRYRIDEIVGQGGMSAVYKAYDPNLKRVVAVKTIHTHLAGDVRFLARFEEEAAAVAQLRHPNIVQVFDFNHDGDLYYMVQEFVAGETLQERLRRLSKAGKRLPLAEAIGVAVGICEAASYAHRRGMVHRDIKPANIMLDVHGQAILMDFGIVKIAGAERHTATGAVVGTALYMPPEMIQGEPPDARSDLYSLGVTLYEMVSGRPPFEADSAMTLMMMHLHDPVPDLRALRPGVPEELIAVIEKALAKDRAQRHASMGELAAALRQVQARLESASVPAATALEQPPVEAVPSAPRPVRKPAQPPAASAAGAGAPPAAPGSQPPGGGATLLEEPVSASAPPPIPTRVESPSPDRFTEREPGAGSAQAKHEPAAGPPLPRRKLAPAVWIGAAVLLLIIAAGVLAIVLGGRDGDGQGAAPTAVAQVTEPSLLPTQAAAAPATAEPSITPALAPTEAPTLTPEPTATATAEPSPTAVPSPKPLATPTVPVGVAFARIKGITLDSKQRYVVEYETFEFTEKLPGVHLHFFFNTVPPEQAGKPGNGPWTIYGGPRPFAGIGQADRPENASQMCVLVANADHSVQLNSGTCSILPDVVAAVALEDLACRAGPATAFPAVGELKAGQVALVRGLSADEGWWNVAHPQKLDERCWLPLEGAQVSGDISTLPLVEGPPLPTGTAQANLAVEIKSITLNELGAYVVEFETIGFAPQLPGTHLHFFFDNVPPEEVGIDGAGLRRMHGSLSPFTGYGAADRPAGAGKMCALVANPDHSVQLGSGNCLPLPDVPQP